MSSPRAFPGSRWLRLSPDDQLRLPAPLGRDIAMPGIWLAVVTGIAVVLRLWGLGSELWLDEIVTVQDSRASTLGQLLTTYESANRHLLNSVLVRLMLTTLGDSEVAIRLPAAVMGIASVPAIYLLARIALRSREALLAAALLAGAYHHIFFSQNARGYAGVILFSLLGTAFFLRALTRGRVVDWAAYVVTMTLGFATMILAAFILAGQMVTLMLVAWQRLRLGRSTVPLVRATLLAWAALGLCVLAVYGPMLPDLFAYFNDAYDTDGGGYTTLSLEYAVVWLRGVAAGFGANALWAGALVIGVAVAVGVWYSRRHPVYAAALVSPLILQGAYAVVTGGAFSPRFFIWALAVSCIVAVTGSTLVGEMLSDRFGAGWRRHARQAPVAVVVCLLTLSSVGLNRYYRIPKQPTRVSAEWLVGQQGDDDTVAAISLARWGLRYYGPRVGLREHEDFVVVDTAEQFEALRRERGDGQLWVVTTLRRWSRLDAPELLDAVERDFQAVEIFDGTLGDGQVTIWRAP